MKVSIDIDLSDLLAQALGDCPNGVAICDAINRAPPEFSSAIFEHIRKVVRDEIPFATRPELDVVQANPLMLKVRFAGDWHIASYIDGEPDSDVALSLDLRQLCLDEFSSCHIEDRDRKVYEKTSRRFIDALRKLADDLDTLRDATLDGKLEEVLRKKARRRKKGLQP